jgi:hypothetical protein
MDDYFLYQNCLFKALKSLFKMQVYVFFLPLFSVNRNIQSEPKIVPTEVKGLKKTGNFMLKSDYDVQKNKERV